MSPKNVPSSTPAVGQGISIETSEPFTWNKLTMLFVLLIVVGCLAFGFAITGKFRDSAEGKARAAVIEETGPQIAALELMLKRQAAEDYGKLRITLVYCGILLAVVVTICLGIGVPVLTYNFILSKIERRKKINARVTVLPPDHQLARAGNDYPGLPAKVPGRPAAATTPHTRVSQTRPDGSIPVSRVDSEAIHVDVKVGHLDRS